MPGNPYVVGVLVGDRVYKLKKPVRFPYLDFSSVVRREAACRAELRLNRALAPDIYLDVLPLVDTGAGLSIGGAGTPVDWLVYMKRLDERDMLDRRIGERRVETLELDRLVAALAQFYHAAAPVFLSPAVHLADWKRSLAYNRSVLLDPRFAIPAGLVRRIDRAQRRFLERRGHLIAARLEVDGRPMARAATLRARLAIAHLLEAHPRMPEKWPRLAVTYLKLADTSARKLEVFLRRPADR